MDESQIITKVFNDGTTIVIRARRLPDQSVEFEVAKDYCFSERVIITEELEISRMFYQLQQDYFGKVMEETMDV